jgi:hypothetical protein
LVTVRGFVFPFCHVLAKQHNILSHAAAAAGKEVLDFGMTFFVNKKETTDRPTTTLKIQ